MNRDQDQIKKNDILSALALGFVIVLLLIPIIKNTNADIFLGKIGISFRAFILLLFVVFPVGAASGLLTAFLLGRKFKIFFQLGKFGIIGITNTAIDFGVLNLLIIASRAGYLSDSPILDINQKATFYFLGAYSIFKAVSSFIAITHSFFWNKFWTFKKQNSGNARKEFLQFVVVTVIGGAINVSIASFVVNVIGSQGGLNEAIWENIGAGIGSISLLAWNFLGYKFIVFRKKDIKKTVSEKI